MLLQIKNLTVDFVTEHIRTNALKDISFNINKGEILALVGESGSGKSVIALSILKLLPSPPSEIRSGNILFTEEDGKTIDLTRLGFKEMQKVRGNRIAMIFQEPMTSLNPVLNCGSQVMESLRLHKNLNSRDAKQMTIEWFRKVKLPDPPSIFKRYPHQLSGGQKQRVMIALAMCCHPSLLICDEPTTALDVTVQANILQLIRELQSEVNMGVLFITHDLGVVASIADRAAVMYKGEIVELNDKKQIFSSPAHAYTKALLACRPANHKRGERLPVVADFLKSGADDHNTASQPTITPSDGQRNESNFQPVSPTKEILFSVRNLSVWFPTKTNLLGKAVGHLKAVDDVSFEVNQGETLGLVGESGCGKTTLGRTILQLIEPNSGTILYKGIDLTKMKNRELHAMRQDIQIIFQDPYSSLNPRMTIGAAIAEPLAVHGLQTSASARTKKVNELLEKVSLQPSHQNRYPHEFSGGQRQRIVIARALALNPGFIVCDESVSALDISVQAQVLNLLNDLKKEFGFTIIFISHDLSVVRYLSDRIMVMKQGKIVESGMADEIYYNPQTDYTRKLIASIPKVQAGQ